MLIYNHKKEFVGIDASDLEALGFKNLEELLAESSDFADMFVKTPGYVHNFQHVSWIDFVDCADSTDNTKVIIRAKSRDFRCLLEVKTAYLMENKSSKAFLITLTNLRELMAGEDYDMPTHFPPRPTQTSTPTPAAAFEIPQEKAFQEVTEQIRAAQEKEEIFEAPISLDTPLELELDDKETSLEEDLAIDLDIDDNVNEFATPDETPAEKEIPVVEETQTYMEVFDNGYIFDPHVASDELGLPVDLIEEFIEDFIAQAKEFKNELYQSLDDGDIDNIKTLSHKLKGVAANLRIEDALEHLTIANTSPDLSEISTNLETFYKIVSKLAGEKIPVTKTMAAGLAAEELEELVSEKDIEIDNTIHDNDDDLDMFLAPKDETTEDEIQIDMGDTVEDDDLEIFAPQNDNISIEDNDDEIQIDMSDTVEDDALEIFAPQNDISIEDEASINETAKVSSYDPVAVAQDIGLSHEYFMELLQDYLEEAQELSKTISSAIEENNAALWNRKAIQLKGMSDNMRIQDFTTEIETLIQTDDVSTAREASINVAEAIAAIAKIEE